MKNILFILGLLMSILLFAPEDGMNSDEVLMSVTQRGAVMKEKTAADMQHHFEVLSNELKDNNFLTPRRSLQTTSNTSEVRALKNEKLIQHMRLKEENLLHKVSRNVSVSQTINLSSLLCRMGQHIFALRKLII